MVKHAAARTLQRVGVDPSRLRNRFKPVREAKAEWYDDVYRVSEEYGVHYRKSPYMPVWESIAERIGAPTAVLEIGCGPGQLAHFLHDEGLLSEYVGFDLSSVAVSSARERVPGRRFEVADVHTTDLIDASHFDLVVCTEVLEHIQHDREVLRRIPAGKRVIATVPDFPSETHVRWFNGSRSVERRYRKSLAGLTVNPIRRDGWTIFILDGTAV